MDESRAQSCHPASIGQAFLWALLPTLLLVLTPPNGTYAQTNITPTTTAPFDLGTDVATVGTTTQITGGTRPLNGTNPGTNLFHSFDFFTLDTGDVAHFMNDMQLPTNNIFGRVIGGEVSTIDGILRTNNPLDVTDLMNFGTANLWLVNPSGIFLGPNARIEVGGSVSMSTANYLRFSGTPALFFDMLSTPASLGPLSVASVVAFGFLGSNPGTVIVQGSQFSVTDGKTISLVGGNISMESGTPEGGPAQPARLSAPNGKIQLASAASPGEFNAATLQPRPNVNATSFTSFGSVSLAPGSNINVSGTSTVSIKGGQLVLSVNDAVLTTAQTPGLPETISLSPGSSIVTSNSGADPGADVHITAGSLTLESASAIFTRTQTGNGEGGDLLLKVRTLSLLGGPFGISLIQSSNSNVGSGVGGDVTVQGQGVDSSVVLSGGSQILSFTQASGAGGQISITAKSLDLSGSDASGEVSTIASSSTGSGHGGDIVARVQQLRVVGGATISSRTSAGAGGMVTVQGLEGQGSKASSVRLSGQNTGIFSESSSGVPGDISVNAGILTITNGAAISAGSPQATGPAGEVAVTADSIVISAGGQIFSQSFAQAAGLVTIKANQLTLDNGSIVTNTSSEIGGRGGDVMLHVGTVSLTNGASISSQSLINSTGRAGDISITSGSLTLANQAEITSSSKGTVANAGDAGNVTITSSGAFTSDASTIATSAEHARGGNIDVTAQSVALSNGTLISANSNAPLLPDGEGNAGNITIQSGSTVVMNNSSMTTEASLASGGQIEITAPEMVRLIDSTISTSVAGSTADTSGGNITIDPQFVILQNSQIIAKAVAGAGGAIDITAGVFLADPNSIVDASSTLGISGTVNIQSPVQNVGGRLTPLSQQFSSAAALLAQRCAARVADGKFSTFVVAGREGLPAEPGGFLASPSWTAELFGSSLSGRDRHTQFPAVTGAFPEYDARPIQLAKFGDACH